jgi:hypothetical protein
MVNEFPLKFFPRFAYDQFVKPQYGSYNFGNIHATVLKLFGIDSGSTLLPKDCFGEDYPQPRVVVFFFLDAFGWKFWNEADPGLKALARIKEEGRVTPLTTLFPSTTAASVTTFHTGVLPAQHALYEWNLFIPEYDDVIQTLVFSPLGEKVQDGCRAKGYDPAQLFNQSETLVGRLEEHGVKTIQFLPPGYSASGYNSLIGRGGSSVQPYRSAGEALPQIKESIRQAKGPTFIYFYYPEIDGAMHQFGPDSAEAKASVAQFWTRFAEVFGSYEKPEDALFLFAADHGQIGSDPEKAIYLNQLAPELLSWLKTHRDGRPVMPNGSSHDVFLHIKEEFVDQALAILRERLDLKALVLSTQDALEQGLFGPPPFNQRFLDRLGQILILPYESRQIWWYDPPRLYAKHRGLHGGLTPEEALTVLAAW